MSYVYVIFFENKTFQITKTNQIMQFWSCLWVNTMFGLLNLIRNSWLSTLQIIQRLFKNMYGPYYLGNYVSKFLVPMIHSYHSIKLRSSSWIKQTKNLKPWPWHSVTMKFQLYKKKLSIKFAKFKKKINTHPLSICHPF